MAAGVLEAGSEEGETQAAATGWEGTAPCPREGREVTVVPAGGRCERLEGEPQVQVCRVETVREQENRANGEEATKPRPAG